MKGHLVSLVMVVALFVVGFTSSASAQTVKARELTFNTYTLPFIT